MITHTTQTTHSAPRISSLCATECDYSNHIHHAHTTPHVSSRCATDGDQNVPKDRVSAACNHSKPTPTVRPQPLSTLFRSKPSTLSCMHMYPQTHVCRSCAGGLTSMQELVEFHSYYIHVAHPSCLQAACMLPTNSTAKEKLKPLPFFRCPLP